MSTNPAKDELQAAYDQGSQCLQDGNFQCALYCYEVVAKRDASPQVRCNLGQVHEAMHHYVAALESFEECRSLGEMHMTAEERKRLTERIDYLKKPGSLKIDSNVRGAEVVVDNHIVGTTPFTMDRVAPGKHTIWVRQKNYRSKPQELEIAPGEMRTAVVSLPLPPPPPPPPREKSFPWCTVCWTATGALAVGALATGVWAMTESKSQTDRLSTYPITRAELDAGASRVILARNLSLGLAAATAASGALSLWLTFRTPHACGVQTTQNQTALAVGLSASVVQARLSF